MCSRVSVLVVGDDPDFAGNVRGALEAAGYEVHVCATGREALDTMADKPAQLVVLDLKAAGGDALELVDGTKRLSSESEIVVITSREGLQNALQAFKDKAFAYLTEPVDPEHLLMVAGKALQRRSTREVLRETNERLCALIEASPLPIITLDRDGNVTLWSRAAECMFGWTEQEVIGRALPIVPDDRQNEFRENLRRVLSGESLTGLLATRRGKDGTVIDARIYAAPLHDRKGNIVGVMAMIANVTKRRQLEAQLYRSQRLEAVGRLAGGIAHEFKNLLMGISGYAEILQMRLGREHPQFPVTNDLLNCVDRASRLVSQLQTFSKRQAIDARPTDLNELVIESEHLLERLLGEHISMGLNLSPKECVINADPVGIEQALVNLAINARDAMPQGGQLTISTRNRRLQGTVKLKHPDWKPGKYVELSVADTGTGMDEATRDRIFEPFFTTKETDERTGLGLAVTYGIIRQHNGYIDVSSEIGKGTTFRVYLPRIENATIAEHEDKGHKPKRGTETILLAEDEDVVRTPVKSVLERYGYTVLSASDGEEAVELFKQHADNIDLAVLDLVMPKAGGKCVWQTMSEKRPDLKVLFISGYTRAAIHKDFKPPSDMPFLSKPFSVTEMAGRIRELLS